MNSKNKVEWCFRRQPSASFARNARDLSYHSSTTKGHYLHSESELWTGQRTDLQLDFLIDTKEESKVIV